MNQLEIIKSFSASYRRLMALIGPLVIAAALGLALFVAAAPSYATRAGDRLPAAEPVWEEMGRQHDSVLSPLAASSPVTATAMYTITDLGVIGPGRINDEGEVLGFFNNSYFLWLPEPAYGLPAGLNDLSFLDVWIISDINNDLMLVGTAYVPEGCDDDYYAVSVQRIFDEDASTWQWITTILPTEDPWDLSRGIAINNNGVIAGRVEDNCTEEEEHEGRIAARWQSGVMSELGTLDGDESYAYAINDLGQIVGVSSTETGSNPPEHAFLWTNGSMTDLGTLTGTTESRAVDLNDLGQVIGQSDERPFIWLPAPDYGLIAGMHELASFSPDPIYTLLHGINNQGQIVGMEYNSGDGLIPYLWDKGTAYDLNDLIDPDAGWNLQSATDVNENGEIVGYGSYEGQLRGFLLTPQKKWTVMLYLDGDNNLDWTYPPILNQLETAADNPNVNVIVYHDDLGFPGTDYYEIQHDLDLYNLATYTLEENWWPQGEQDTSLAVTLLDFVIWAMENYPADHYALVLDDHGSGLAGGLVDETSSNSLMDLLEMEEALATIYGETSEKIDVLYMAMCLMGMLEDAYQFREYVDYYVANENLQWTYVAPYSQYISGIDDNSSPAQVAVNFAQAYADVAFAIDKPYTISAVDLAQLDPLVIATNSLGAALEDNMDVISPTLDTVTDNVQRFDNEGEGSEITLDDTYIDLYDFASRVSVSMSGYADIFSASEAVKTTLNNYVIFESHGHSTADVNVDNSHGVSIFFPVWASSFYNPENYDFAVGANWSSSMMLNQNGNSGTWGSMLVSYFQATQPGGPVDDTPPEPRPKLIPFNHPVYLPILIRN